MADRRENAAATALASTLLLSIALTTSACSGSLSNGVVDLSRILA